MPTSTNPIQAERLALTRISVQLGLPGSRCQVRTSMTQSDSTASGIRPMLVEHDAESARISLVPEGALLLAGDAVELEISVGPRARLDLIEPGGTVAFNMSGGRARWDVRICVQAGGTLTWAGEPFIVADGADVDRSMQVQLGVGARVALRESLVLGRHGELPGSIRQQTRCHVGDQPVLFEDLPLDSRSAPGLLGRHRVLSSVLVLGAGVPEDEAALKADPHRLALEDGGHLWRRLGTASHEAELTDAWKVAQALLA